MEKLNGGSIEYKKKVLDKLAPGSRNTLSFLSEASPGLKSVNMYIEPTLVNKGKEKLLSNKNAVLSNFDTETARNDAIFR